MKGVGGWGESLSGVLLRKLWAWGAVHVPLPISQTRLFPKKERKKKAQFENLLPKEGYTCGRGSGEFGARLWGRGLAGTDVEDLAHVLSSPRGLPDSVRGGEGN